MSCSIDVVVVVVSSPVIIQRLGRLGLEFPLALAALGLQANSSWAHWLFMTAPAMVQKRLIFMSSCVCVIQWLSALATAQQSKSLAQNFIQAGLGPFILKEFKSI